MDNLKQTKTQMKFVLQIALGVFLGTLASAATMEVWRQQRESEARHIAENLRAKQELARREQGERIRALLMQGQQHDPQQPEQTTLPPNFIPDDAHSQPQ